MVKHRWWICGLGGLALGWLCQPLTRHAKRGGPETPTIGAEAQASKQRTRLDRGRSTAKPGRSTEFLRDAATADTGECETQVLEILASEDSNRSVELETVLRRWMSLEEPEQLLIRLDQLTKGKIWQRWTGPVFNAWVATDYTSAMATPAKLDQFSHARKIAAIEHLDPNFADYLKLEDSSFRESVDLTQALRVLGRDHPELASSLSTSDLRNSDIRAAMNWVVGGWASSDPASALAWVQGLKLSPAESGWQLRMVFGEWSRIDRSAARNAMTAAGYDESTFGQLGGIHSLPAELTGLLAPATPTTEIQLELSKNPFLDVAGLYEKLEASGIDWEKPGYLQPSINHDGWYSPDPAAAAAEAEKLPPGKLRDFLFKTIGLSRWHGMLFRSWRGLLGSNLSEYRVAGLHGSIFESGNVAGLAAALGVIMRSSVANGALPDQ